MSTSTGFAANYWPATHGIPTADGGLMVHTLSEGKNVKAGDLFRPITDQYPFVVTTIRHARGYWRITDQHGSEWKYRDSRPIPTASHLK